MTDSTALKIQRSEKHIRELSELLNKTKPYVCAVRTDRALGITNHRFFYIKENTQVINEASTICGDAIHNLRSSLDHVYWEIISPHCNDKEKKTIQFPFSEKLKDLDQNLQKKCAHYGGAKFYQTIKSLNLHGETGGNESLYLLHKMNNLDKHKLLIPIILNTKVMRKKWMQALPDWPDNAQFKTINFIGYKGIIDWVSAPIPVNQLGIALHPAKDMYERELDIPIEISLQIEPQETPKPVIKTLNELVKETQKTIALLRISAKAP